MKKDYAISHNYINILLILDDNIMKHREEYDIHIYIYMFEKFNII